MVVTAEPTVSAVILTPEADRKEGGQVDMKCNATNHESNHIVEWRVEDPWTTLRWGGSTITANPRFIFHTINQEPNTVEQRFTIVDLHIDDIDDYVCAVREPTQVLDTFDTVTTARVSFSVFYFPGEAFPVCSTSGLLTVIAGAETNINCSSEHGNSAVEVEIATSTMTPRTTSKASSINNTIVLSSRLTLEVADNGVEFECSISSSYFPNMRRSCTMGPIKVLPNTDVVTGHTYSTPYLSSNATFSSEHTFESSSMSTDSPEHTSVNVNPWIIAFALSMILLVIFLIIAVRLLFEVVKLRRIHQHPNETQPKAPNDTYMDLQPTDDRRGGYNEPTTDETPAVQHVYGEQNSRSRVQESDSSSPRITISVTRT